MDELHSISRKRELYVMRCGSGYSCSGFDVLDKKARAVVEWMSPYGDTPIPADMQVGTEQHFNWCASVMDAGALHAKRTGSYCAYNLVPALIGLEGRRVVAEVGGERMTFTVRRSTGWMPVHIAVTAGSDGGIAIHKDGFRLIKVT